MNEIIINENLKRTLTILGKDEISRLDISDIQNDIRRVVEEVEEYYETIVEKNTFAWKVLHSELHTKTAKYTKTKVLDSIYDILTSIRAHYQNIYIDQILELIESKSNFYSDDFWNFVEVPSREKVRTIFVKKIRLINKTKKISMVVADVEGRVSELSFLTNLELKQYTQYKIQQTIFKNNSIPKIYWIKALEEVQINFDEKVKTQLLNVISQNQNTPLWYLLKTEDWIKIINTLNTCWPTSYDCREFLKQSQKIIWTLNQHKTEIDKTSGRKYYAFVIDNPFIINLPSKQLPVNFKKAMLSNYSFYNLNNRLIEWEFKNFLDDFSILFCSKEFLKNNNDTLFKKIQHDYNFESINHSSFNIVYKDEFITINPYEKYARTLRAVFSNDKSKIILAPAGHGKSTHVKTQIIKTDHDNFIVVTPTRKAHEVYNDLKVATTTIQKLVFDDSFSKTNYIFDEISMYSAEHWEYIANLLKHLEDSNCTIYLVGDENQLEPIGENNHFFLIKEYISGKKSPELPINMRLSIIPESAKKEMLNMFDHVLDNSLNEKINTEKYKNKFVFYGTYSELFKEIDQKTSYFANKKEKFRIIVEKNNGIVSVNNFNRAIISKDGADFKIGDEVIFNEDVPNRKEFYIGQLRIIKDIIGLNVELPDVEKAEEFIFENEVKLVVYNEDYPFSNSLTITAHKSQGQTYDNAIVIIDKNQVVNKRWLYTAISRIKKEVFIFCPSHDQLVMIGESNYKKEWLAFFKDNK